jgi:DNA-binding response OmpR family regulator
MKTLIVTPDPVLREVLLGAADALGFQSACVPCCADALRYREREPVRLAVVDIEIPGESGLDVCVAIREADPTRETFVLMLAGKGSPEELKAVLDAGADDYMTRPFTPDNVQARLLIAERRMLRDAERRAAEETLARSRRVTSIGETSIALQHEINNPLSALLGHAELMMLEANDTGADTESLRVILEQARRIADVVKRLGRLRDPQTVEYAPGARMLDLSEQDKDQP